MVEIELSIISVPGSSDLVDKALKEFEAQSGIRVKVHNMSWDSAWNELVRAAIYKKHGLDVSEVGSTWVGDLMEMNALHSFNQPEIRTIGGPEAFIQSAWLNGSSAGGKVSWAIPWLADSRFLYYRRDWLEKAGVDEKTAFKTPAAFANTLQAIKDAGSDFPWVIPSRKTGMSLHNVAAWVWGAGGHFLSQDGKSTRFSEPAALQGFTQYFELGRFLAPTAHDLDDRQSDAMYWQGKAAATISGPWLLREPSMEPEIATKTGITFPPGVPFVGGSSLVIWEDSPNRREALALVKFLTSEYVQRNFLQNVGLLPVRIDVLSAPPFSDNPTYQSLSDGLQIGRSFRLLHLWGLVEDRLSKSLSFIWNKVLQEPETNVAEVVEQELSVLARQLDRILSGG
ncbi:MAG: extracellular solute-binding protein [Chloroflexota bacterium]|nr:MAG: extracellular solute-binding protein [Chloroflexota bacterium]